MCKRFNERCFVLRSVRDKDIVYGCSFGERTRRRRTSLRGKSQPSRIVHPGLIRRVCRCDYFVGVSLEIMIVQVAEIGGFCDVAADDRVNRLTEKAKERRIIDIG